jgi:hypothetical protein
MLKYINIVNVKSLLKTNIGVEKWKIKNKIVYL